MRILVVNWQDRLNPDAGGAEVHLHEIFGRLARAGHDVTLLVSGWGHAPAETAIDGMRVVRTGSRYTFPMFARRAGRRLGPDSFDVIVEDINKVPLFTPRWSRTPVVALVPHLFGTTAFRQESLPVAAGVWASEKRMPGVYAEVPFLVISESTADDLVGRGFDRAHIRVSHPGIDHERYTMEAGAPRYPEPTLVYVGRLQKYKGLGVVLRAVRLLAEQGLDVRFYVAGRGGQRRALERRTVELELGDRVRFLGYVDEDTKVDLLRRAWANVYPSPKEGWGITNIEAAACGTPTVASDSPGLRESVLEGETGFLVPHRDASAWADRIARLCREPSLRDRLGRGGNRYAERFTWDQATRDAEGLLAGAVRHQGD